MYRQVKVGKIAVVQSPSGADNDGKKLCERESQARWITKSGHTQLHHQHACNDTEYQNRKIEAEQSGDKCASAQLLD